MQTPLRTNIVYLIPMQIVGETAVGTSTRTSSTSIEVGEIDYSVLSVASVDAMTALKHDQNTKIKTHPMKERNRISCYHKSLPMLLYLLLSPHLLV